MNAANAAMDQLDEDAIINDMTDMREANSRKVVDAMVMGLAKKRGKVVRKQNAASLLNKIQQTGKARVIVRTRRYHQVMIDAIRDEPFQGKVTHADIQLLTLAACDSDDDEAFHDKTYIIHRLCYLRKLKRNGRLPAFASPSTSTIAVDAIDARAHHCICGGETPKGKLIEFRRRLRNICPDIGMCTSNRQCTSMLERLRLSYCDALRINIHKTKEGRESRPHRVPGTHLVSDSLLRLWDNPTTDICTAD